MAESIAHIVFTSAGTLPLQLKFVITFITPAPLYAPGSDRHIAFSCSLINRGFRFAFTSPQVQMMGLWPSQQIQCFKLHKGWQEGQEGAALEICFYNMWLHMRSAFPICFKKSWILWQFLSYGRLHLTFFCNDTEHVSLVPVIDFPSTLCLFTSHMQDTAVTASCSLSPTCRAPVRKYIHTYTH